MQQGLTDLNGQEKYKSRVAESYRELLRREVRAKINAEKAVANTAQPKNVESSPKSGGNGTAENAAKTVTVASTMSSAQTVKKPSIVKPSARPPSGRRGIIGSRGGNSTTKSGGGLGAKKLTSKVDSSLFEQKAMEPVTASKAQSDETKTNSGVPITTGSFSSRFAYEDDSMSQQPSTTRDASGHVKIPSTDNGLMMGTATASGRRFSGTQTLVKEEKTSESAQTRFQGNKSISSDQYFDRDESTSSGADHISTRFAGATSISSADMFGHSNANGQVDDLQNLKRLGTNALRKAANFFNEIR